MAIVYLAEDVLHHRAVALKPAEVRSAVSFKTGEYAPDFHAFETDNYIILPGIGRSSRVASW